MCQITCLNLKKCYERYQNMRVAGRDRRTEGHKIGPEVGGWINLTAKKTLN